MTILGLIVIILIGASLPIGAAILGTYSSRIEQFFRDRSLERWARRNNRTTN